MLRYIALTSYLSLRNVLHYSYRMYYARFIISLKMIHKDSKISYISNKIIFNIIFFCHNKKILYFVIQSLFSVHKIFKYFFIELKHVSSIGISGFLHKSKVKSFLVLEGTVFFVILCPS